MTAGEVLRTQRLLLRELTEADAPFMLELLNQPGFLKNIGDRGVRTLDDARVHIGVQRSRYAQLGYGLWAAALSSGELIGLCGLVRRNGLEHPDLGYAFLARHEGQGYATEAAAAVVSHVRRNLGIGALAAITSPENAASIAVLEKLGFRFVGLKRLPGEDKDVRYFEA
ncbi:GNAT family N-acetyltransferase [Phenylobacterium deserti]|uniref:GNAT family N-acetyltransferase n=1 Tax=Phenylobacterium deserti TaxID=1914756 RepID=A0A328ABI9_9CAUL|nr:GNAT family N-acetyltransferase [Phenylobacterium deserti]RAK52010.1 GNAT family N-acetyltransferase [Phenylobacterium deserti]